MIIGIAGNINSGKDTVASILLYLNAVGKNNAKFADWLTKRLAYDNSFKHKIAHFADTAKLNLSNMFHLSVDYFNNREYKDTYWYIPSTGKFIEEEHTARYKKITIDNIEELDIFNKKHIIKLRTLLQSYAEYCKQLFGDIWIKCGIESAYDKNSMFGICIIPDVRFDTEVEAIIAHKGIVIKINRTNNEISSNHISENNDVQHHYLIENDGSLQTLFFKVLALYDEIKSIK